MRFALHVLLLAAVLLAGCGRPAPESGVTLTVSAAASLQEALQEIAERYEAAHPGVRLRLNLAASGTLEQQIRQGAPVDLFLSAAPAQMDALEEAGLIDPSTRRDFAGNELVLVVPAAPRVEVRGFRDLASPAVERVAIGAPASVPAGRYSEATLRSLGVAGPVLAKAVLGQHVRQVLAYVERGEVDAGIVYRTDAATRAGVRVVAAAPPGSHAPIVYPLAVVSRSAHPEEARSLTRYLLEPAAQEVLRRHGFRPPTAAPSGR